MSDHLPIEAFIDGACSGNPGPGGWGVVLQRGAKVKEYFGGEPQTTNNRMELQAAIEAFKALKKPERNIILHSDSQYVVKGMTEWLPNWKARGWKTATKKPVENQDLWVQLDGLASQHKPVWKWVKGHAGHPGNERADTLARRGVPKV